VHGILLGETRFSQIRQHVGISPSMLAQRLRYLTDCGVLARTARSARPPQFDYQLTAKGQDLAPVLAALCRLGGAYAAQAGRRPVGNDGTRQACNSPAGGPAPPLIF
jgi:DNA-binding HxlR family transcriptional regulator